MDRVFDELKRAIRELYGVEVAPEVTVAPAKIEADYASNVAMKLAGQLHRAPMEIAGELRDWLEKAQVERGQRMFEVGVSKPGFLNFVLSDECLLRGMEGKLESRFAENISSDEYDRGKSEQVEAGEKYAPGEYMERLGQAEAERKGASDASGEYAGKTVICEFSDPNPFKVLHVGHLYTSVVGNAIANLFEYAGAKVVRANFGGDVGLHVAKTMYALAPKVGVREDARGKDLQGEFEKRLGEVGVEDIAECYVEGTAKYEEDAEAKQRIDQLNKEIYAINAEGKHDSELAQLYWRGRELSYAYFEDFYRRIGVKFDKYYPESTVAERGRETVLRELERGVYEKSEGAVVFNGEPYGLHTRVFINREGVPTYEAKDVGLIFTKWEDYHFDRSVVITGNEQLDYMRVVLKSVEQYAPELVERTTHLTHGLVKLPGNVKMSSRKGNFLKAVEVLELVAGALAEEYGSNDERVVLAAVKYAFLRYKMGGDIIFDPRESVKMNGNSGPYLLYSCVRAKKILARVDKNASAVSERDFSGTHSRPFGQAYGPEKVDSGAGGLALDAYERGLVKKILEFGAVLDEAVAELAPHKVAGYLYELAQEFSRFYEKCPVVGSEKAGMRAKMVRAYLGVMTRGLEILGIEIPEEM